MPIEYYQRIINNLDKEIKDLEARKAKSEKMSSDYQREIDHIERDLSRNKSGLRDKRKLEQKILLKNKFIQEDRRIVGYLKKIYNNRSKRNDAYIKLHKLEIDLQRNM